MIIGILIHKLRSAKYVSTLITKSTVIEKLSYILLFFNLYAICGSACIVCTKFLNFQWIWIFLFWVWKKFRFLLFKQTSPHQPLKIFAFESDFLNAWKNQEEGVVLVVCNLWKTRKKFGFSNFLIFISSKIWASFVMTFESHWINVVVLRTATFYHLAKVGRFRSSLCKIKSLFK